MHSKHFTAIMEFASKIWKSSTRKGFSQLEA